MNIDEFDQKYINKSISLRQQTLTGEFDQKYFNYLFPVIFTR